MLERYRAKYANQTLFNVAAYLINRNYTCGKDLYPIWSQIKEELDIDQSDYIEAVIREVDFSNLLVDDFISSIDESGYAKNLIPSGLHYYDGYYEVTDWNNHLPTHNFIKYILIMNKHWEVLNIDSVYKNEEIQRGRKP